MLLTLCDIQSGWISCSRASARCWRGQFTLLGQAFPRTIRDQPQVQSRQKMKCPTVQKIAAGIRLWDTWLVCDQFTRSRHYWLSDHSNMKRLPLFEMSKGLWFVSLFPPPQQKRGFPWGHWDIFYTTWTIQKAQIFTDAFVTLAYCLRHAVSRGIKYFHYGLWYCLWYTERGQRRSLFMAWQWNFDINYCVF